MPKPPTPIEYISCFNKSLFTLKKLNQIKLQIITFFSIDHTIILNQKISVHDACK